MMEPVAESCRAKLVPLVRFGLCLMFVQSLTVLANSAFLQVALEHCSKMQLTSCVCYTACSNPSSIPFLRPINLLVESYFSSLVQERHCFVWRLFLVVFTLVRCFRKPSPFRLMFLFVLCFSWHESARHSKMQLCGHRGCLHSTHHIGQPPGQALPLPRGPLQSSGNTSS